MRSFGQKYLNKKHKINIKISMLYLVTSDYGVVVGRARAKQEIMDSNP
jgi:hypothetical protein